MAAAFWSQVRVSRRATLGRAAAGVAAGALTAACGTRAPRAAAPQAQGGGIEIVFQANNQGVAWNPTTQRLYQDFVDTNFNATAKGIRATVFPGGWGNPQQQIVASIAGSGFADIYHGCCDDIATMTTAGWLLPLDAYLRKDNIATSIWSAGHLAGLTFGGQLFGLPSYDGPGVIAYRQDLLDQLGLQYPDPSWTSATAAQLWQACTGRDSKGRKRLGVEVIWNDPATTWQYWVKGWGGEIMNAAHDSCQADTPQAAQALDYLAGLSTAGVMKDGSGVDDLVSGTVVFAMCGGWNVFDEATKLGTRYKWDILPVPNWPKGRATFGNVDFYGLNRASKNPDAAWQVLSWLTAQPDWQRFQMKATLVEPCLLSLWDEWETIVTTAAPPLKGKALSWYKDAAMGYAYATLHFAYGPAKANAAADNWLNQIWSGKVTADLALPQLAAQVNAIEAASRNEQAQASSAAAAFPTNGPEMAEVLTGV
jgi:ABC-type glycerol-3-phosphate transport system substrate-binding protein